MKDITRNHTEAYQTLFEGIDTTSMTPAEMMNYRKLFNYIVESGDIAKAEGVTLGEVIDEGILGSIVGAISGATILPGIMKAICEVLGIKEKSVLWDLMTSRVVLAAMAGKVGMRL